jgi:hypothetical protein
MKATDDPIEALAALPPTTALLEAVARSVKTTDTVAATHLVVFIQGMRAPRLGSRVGKEEAPQ